LLDGMLARREPSLNEARIAARTDVECLLGLPEWALEKAIMAFRSGQIADGRFRPGAGEIRIEAAKLVEAYQFELGKIVRVLQAKIAPPKKPIDPEQRKRTTDAMKRSVHTAMGETEISKLVPAEKSAEQLATEYAAKPLATSDALRQRIMGDA
jgi:hypothetical protein